MASRQRIRPLTVWSWLGCGIGLLALVLTVGSCGSPASDQPASSSGSSVSRATDRVPVNTAVSSTAPSGSSLAGAAGELTPFPARREVSVSLGTSGTGTVATKNGDRLLAESVPSTESYFQRAAREQWYAAMREAPEAGMRLYALEHWAQQPGEAIDSVTYALVDEDESVRTRAQELYEQRVAREAESETPRGQTP